MSLDEVFDEEYWANVMHEHRPLDRRWEAESHWGPDCYRRPLVELIDDTNPDHEGHSEYHYDAKLSDEQVMELWEMNHI